MKVMLVTNMYPTAEKPTFGIFVAEQESQLKPFAETSVLDIAKGKSGFFSRYIKSFFQIRSALRQNNPDVVHIHFGLTALPCLPLMLSNKRKWVITFHGSDVLGESALVRWVSRCAAKWADLNIAVSPEIESRVRRFAPKTPVTVLPCAVDGRFFEVANKPVTPPVVIFPSDPARPEKNYVYFERVIDLARPEAPEFDTATIKDMSRQQVLELMERASVLLLTSDREGSPQVVKEAAAAGVHVLARDVGDVRLIAATTDRIQVCESEQDMASRLVTLLQEAGQKAKRSGDSHQVFVETYSPQAVGKKLVGYYQAL